MIFFGGVNKPKEWKGTWSYAMYDFLVIAYTFYLKEKHLVDEYIQPFVIQDHELEAMETYPDNVKNCWSHEIRQTPSLPQRSP